MVLSVIRDISDRKRIEEELRRVNEELDRRKSRELRDSQNRLALIVDSSQDAIIGKNLDGIVTHWNKGAEHIYGYTAQEMIGRSITVLAPKERADEIPTILQKIRNGERVEYFESVRVTKDKRILKCLDLSFAHLRRGRQGCWRVDDCPQYHVRKRRSRTSCGNRKRWRRSVDWPAEWPTTSITCWALSRRVRSCCAVASTARAWSTSTTFARRRSAAHP